MKNTKKNDIQGLKFIFTCGKSIEKPVRVWKNQYSVSLMIRKKTHFLKIRLTF
jgi:hypothetical protein